MKLIDIKIPENTLEDSYKFNIFIRIKYKPIKKKIMNKTKKLRNLGIFNKFRNGAKITRIRPTKLLIKNRG